MKKSNSKATSMLKHSSIYALGNLSRQIVSFIMLPIYTHYLSPADYGVVGLLTLSMCIIEPFLGARLGDAIPKFYYAEDDPARRNLVVSTAFIVTAAISSVTVIFTFLLRQPISNLLFGESSYATAVGVFGILFLTQALEYYGFTFIRMQQKPVLFISLSLGKTAVQIALNIALIVALKLGVMGMVISNVASSLLICFVVSGYALNRSGYGLNFSIALSLLKFSWPLWLSGLAVLYTNASNRYFIRIFGSLEQVGLYELAARLAGIVSIMVWTPFYQYWETEQFNIYKAENSAKTFSMVFAFIFVIMGIAASGLSLFSPAIITLMADKQFHSAALAVPFLTISYLFSNLTIFSSFGFMATGKTEWIGRINVAGAVFISILNILLIPTFGFVGASAALMTANIVQFLATKRLSKPLFDIQAKLFPVLISALLIGATYLLFTYVSLEKHFWASLIYATVLFLCTSLGILTIFFLSAESSQALLTSINSQLKTRVPAAKALSAIIDRHLSKGAVEK